MIATSQQRVLVTGGAGYIGSVLVGELLAAGYAVRVLDILRFGGQGMLCHLGRENFEFIHADLCRERELDRALSGVHHVVHLAAIVGDPACAADPATAKSVNRDAAQTLLGKALENGIERFVFASTCSNYGKMPDPNGYVNEDSELRPVSLYAELKVEFEKTLLEFSYPNFVPIVLRFATAYGLSPRPRFDLTVNEFTRELCLGRSLDIYGKQFWRPYAHVADISRACVMAIKAPRETVAGEAFNIGDTHENYQKDTLVKMILEQLPGAMELVSYVEKDEDPRDYRVRFDKAKDRLGYQGLRRVVDGIRETIFAIRSGMIANPDNKLYRNC